MDEMVMEVPPADVDLAHISLTTADDLPVLMAIMTPTYASDQTVRWFSDKPYIIRVEEMSGELEWATSNISSDSETVTITAVAGSVIARRVIIVTPAPETFTGSFLRGEFDPPTPDPEPVPIGFSAVVSDWQDDTVNL
jgi:hypothetical protein